MALYQRVVDELLTTRLMNQDDSILVSCGGPYDAHVLRQSQFHRVTISNIDNEMNRELAPFDWAKQDAEHLTYGDDSFDWAIVNAGLHHCECPHRGLLELCRVARKGVLVLEARDSALVRLAVRLGMTVDYETEAVVLSNYSGGGVRNSPVPNYVYRWTEREVVKTIESAFPHRVNDIRFYYELRIPLQRLAMSSMSKRMLAMVAGAVVSLVRIVLPRQCNEFAFVIMNTGKLKPWIASTEHGFSMSREYRLNYDPEKYRN